MQLLLATATLTALVGAILLLASVLRLGFVASFISTPVLTGFKCGIGLVIVLDQLPKLLGVHLSPSRGSSPISGICSRRCPIARG